MSGRPHPPGLLALAVAEAAPPAASASSWDAASGDGDSVDHALVDDALDVILALGGLAGTLSRTVRPSLSTGAPAMPLAEDDGLCGRVADYLVAVLDRHFPLPPRDGDRLLVRWLLLATADHMLAHGITWQGQAQWRAPRLDDPLRDGQMPHGELSALLWRRAARSPALARVLSLANGLGLPPALNLPAADWLLPAARSRQPAKPDAHATVPARNEARPRPSTRAARRWWLLAGATGMVGLAVQGVAWHGMLGRLGSLMAMP